MSGTGRAETVADLGETALVDRILGGLAVPAGVPGLVQGPGDDAAVVEAATEAAGGGRWVVTTDAQHEGIHFRREWIDPLSLGRRLLAVNLSDVGAMGARPAWAVVALGLPATTPLALVDGLVEGLRAGGRELGCTVVGGDVARVPDRLGLCLTALGHLSGEPLLRSGARAGDGCWLTGRPGRAGVGRLLLEGGWRRVEGRVIPPPSGSDGRERQEGMNAPESAEALDDDRDGVGACLEAFLRPRPPLSLGPRLAAAGLATATIDVSDGVAVDAGRVCRASGVGLVLEAAELARDPLLRRLAPRLGGPAEAVDLALRGGEDYELLCAVAPEHEDDFAAVAGQCGVEVGRVGRFAGADTGLRLRDGERERELEPVGWDHFAAGGSAGDGTSWA